MYRFWLACAIFVTVLLMGCDHYLRFATPF